MVTPTPASEQLPVAAPPAVRRAARELLSTERLGLGLVLGIQGAATVAGLVGPLVLGYLVDHLSAHRSSAAQVGAAMAVFLAALLLQSWLTRSARRRAAALGQGILAQLREGLISGVLTLPLAVVERAGTGDLLTRATNDVELLTTAVEQAVPDMAIATVSALLTMVAMVVVAPPLALILVPAIPPLYLVNRWYLRRATSVYLARQAALARVNSRIQESTSAGSTIEALGLGAWRVERTEDDIRRSLAADWEALRMRLVLFPTSEAVYVIPLFAALLVGGLLHAQGVVTLGQVTTTALYAQQLVNPVDLVLQWLASLQIGAASLARILGVREVPQPDLTGAEPRTAGLEARQVHFEYRPDREVLRGVDLAPPRGRRLAVIGPSGAGKSTLALLLAGVFTPTSGTVEVGGVEASRLPPERLRREVALVTQEQHVFAATLRDNLLIGDAAASDDRLWATLGQVDADRWARRLPHGLDSQLGSGEAALDPAQSQQVALARLLLADPHTLILDEATSLLDPSAARHLERSLAAVLEGRTVVAVAHRLETARQADLVAVVEDGRITELGSHRQLLRSGGTYATLWRAWADSS